MVKKRQRYPKEVELEAVALARESNRTVAEVARDLGIGPSVLHRWIQQLWVGRADMVTPGARPGGAGDGADARGAAAGSIIRIGVCSTPRTRTARGAGDHGEHESAEAYTRQLAAQQRAA
jgi:Transposase